MTKKDRQMLTAAINDWKRQNKGTQGQLAAKCGLRPNNFNEIIRGKRNTTILPVMWIANRLNGYIDFEQVVRILLPKVYAERPDIFARKVDKNG